MLTKNAKNIMLGLMNGWTGLNNYYVDLKKTDGTTTKTKPYASFFTNANASTLSTSYTNIIFGGGTTPETDLDYKLETQISGLTVHSFTLTENISSNLEVGLDSLQYRASVSNNTNENISISEIGFIQNSILLYRKTFDPITLAPGDTYTFAIDLM